MYRRDGGGGGGSPVGREKGVTGAPSETRSMSRGSRWSYSHQPLERQNSRPLCPTSNTVCVWECQFLNKRQLLIWGRGFSCCVKRSFLHKLVECQWVDGGSCQVWKKRNISSTKGLAVRERWQSLLCPWLIIRLEDLTCTNATRDTNTHGTRKGGNLHQKFCFKWKSYLSVWPEHHW